MEDLQIKGDIVYCSGGGVAPSLKAWNYKTGILSFVSRLNTGLVGSIRLLGDTLFGLGVSGDQDHSEIKRWEQGSGRSEPPLKGHREEISCLRVANDYLYSASYDGTVCIWQGNEGAPVRRLEGNEEGITSLKVRKEKTATGGWDGSVRLWDIETGQCSADLKVHTDAISCLKMQAGGDTLVYSGSWDGRLSIWDSRMSKADSYFIGPTCVKKMKAIDEKIAFISSSEPTVRMWDQTGMQSVSVLSHPGPAPFLTAHNKILYSGSSPSTISCWNVAKQESLGSIEGHRKSISCLKAKETNLLSGSYDQVAMVWNMAELENSDGDI